LGALYTELTGLQNILAEMPDRPQVVRFLSSDCLQLLCHTMYVDVGPELLGRAYHLIYGLESLKYDPKDAPLLNSTRESVKVFCDEIEKLRSLLMRGEYKEPATVSTMVWVPLKTAEIFAASPFAVSANRLGNIQETLAFREVIQNALFSVREYCEPLEKVAEAVRELSADRMPTLYLADRESGVLRVLSERIASETAERSEPSPLTTPPLSEPKQSPGQFPRDKASRNRPCPCGSGKKVKNCCWT
jgi:SEC-C motif